MYQYQTESEYTLFGAIDAGQYSQPSLSSSITAK